MLLDFFSVIGIAGMLLGGFDAQEIVTALLLVCFLRLLVARRKKA